MNFTNIITGHSHPSIHADANAWIKWRTCYEGGDDFVDCFLKKFSKREDADDFQLRKSLTPITSFAKAAIKDVRNSIFQRMSGVTRTGGSQAYRAAVDGEGLGVDNRGSSMTSFIGNDILDELLVMGGVGIYVDAPAHTNRTLLGDDAFKPYVYRYKLEDIVNWNKNDPSHPSEYQSILLREYVEQHDSDFGFPSGVGTRFRHVWINENGKVNVQFLDESMGNPGEIFELELTRIPFTFLSIGDSLIKDVVNHQIALLNLWSSNVYYGVQSGFPIYTEQRDVHGAGHHLKRTADADGSAMEGGQGASDTEIKVGVARGRLFDKDMLRPGFIHPSSEPLEANLNLCAQLKKDVRELINLAVVNLGVQASAESKRMDNSGLEAGLSYIGLVLESGERTIASHWAAYESTSPTKRQIARVTYPERWSLKTDKDKVEEATGLHALVNKLPSRQAKKEAVKLVLETLLGNRVSTETLEQIKNEVQSANFTTSDPETIEMAKEQGLLSGATGSEALGFNGDEASKAAEEHVQRLAAIAAHQTTGTQGVPDTQQNPAQDNREIQEQE